MNRNKATKACMIVGCLGTITLTVGAMIASGVDPGGNLSDTLFTISMFFWLLCIVAVVLNEDSSKAERNQMSTELDSSLI